MPLPVDYAERVYAGVLGKIIGVYLGRPFEGWTYDHIMQELGEIQYYVHEKLGKPLVVTDDDISGTFTIVRAMPDYGNSRDLTAEQIGRTLLNYSIEGRSFTWWGGMGASTEHTVYLRLKAGIMPPLSGSSQTNGKIIAEQIGAQIWTDSWAMIAPGDPEYAADLAYRHACMAHDGEGIYGAQVMTALESLAFVESDRMKLLDTAVSFIPKDSTTYRMIADIREWHGQYPDWRQARDCIAQTYNYENYRGVCHIVPNHGLIILGLLYGDDDFQKSLMIANTSGWDTDCNSGNLGCLLGIKNGLAAIDAGPDWRGPVADRMYIPSADGGRAISDAVSEAYRIVNIGRALAHEPPLLPKNGARFHFEMPGSLQGFCVDESANHSRMLRLENVPGHSRDGSRSLALHYDLAPGRSARTFTPTFMPLEEFDLPGYGMYVSPTLCSGQTILGRVSAGDNAESVRCRPFIRLYDAHDQLVTRYGAEFPLLSGTAQDFAWKIEETYGAPIAQIGLEVTADSRAQGTVYLDYLTWDGEPDVTLKYPGEGLPAQGGTAWRHAWVNAVDYWERRWPESFYISHDHGTGMLIQGTREWQNYRVTSTISSSFAEALGIAARVQGMFRYYALLLCADGKARLVKMRDTQTILAEADFAFEWTRENQLALQVQGNHVQGWIDDHLLFDVVDDTQPLIGGAVALVVTEGTLVSSSVRVAPC